MIGGSYVISWAVYSALGLFAFACIAVVGEAIYRRYKR